MKRIALLAVLALAVALAGCSSIDPGYVQADRSTKEAFNPFFSRHIGEEPADKQDALNLFWRSWEARLQEAEGKTDGK